MSHKSYALPVFWLDNRRYYCRIAPCPHRVLRQTRQRRRAPLLHQLRPHDSGCYFCGNQSSDNRLPDINAPRFTETFYITVTEVIPITIVFTTSTTTETAGTACSTITITVTPRSSRVQQSIVVSDAAESDAGRDLLRG